MAIEKTYLTGSGVQLGTSHFDLQAQKPLDSRTTVPEFAGLQALIDGKAAYEGMIVYDEETKKTYQAHKVTVTEDDETSKVILQFKEFGINQEELKALIASETTAAMEFKGVAAILPENPSNGDMYKVGKVGETEPNITVDGVTAKAGDAIVAKVVVNEDKSTTTTWYLIPAGDDIEDTWRPITGVDTDATLTFAAGDKLDVAVAAGGTVTYSHEAIDAPTATPVGKDEQTRTYIASIETDGFGHITGYKTATENVEDTNTTYEFEGLPIGEDEEAPSSVYFQVKSSEEETAEVIYLDAYNKNEADAAFKAKRAEALAAVATDANVFVDTVAQDVDGNITITTKAVDFSAITDRLDDLEAIDHTHNFADEAALNGITAAKVADWDDAVSKEHTHTFADSDVEDAIAKKHSHTFVEAELNKIADGDVAKWNDAYDHSQVAHAPANAQANVIESVKVNGTALEIKDKAVDITVPTGALAGKDKVAKADLDEALATEIDNKVASVTAGDASVTIGGTATVPTVAAKISAAEGNALTLAEDGLKVIIPENTKVEASETNGNIKVDGQEVTVYTHVEKHAIADVDGLQDALNGLQEKGDYAAEEHDHVAADITDFATEVAKVKVNEAVKATQDGNGKVIADTYAEKATTLAGYGIGDAYTKTEIEALLTWGSF
jgi:hypothetical protein